MLLLFVWQGAYPPLDDGDTINEEAKPSSGSTSSFGLKHRSSTAIILLGFAGSRVSFFGEECWRGGSSSPFRSSITHWIAFFKL
jgi:hypothetical protein